VLIQFQLIHCYGRHYLDHNINLLKKKSAIHRSHGNDYAINYVDNPKDILPILK